MKTITIHALDTLFFRDGRPFTMGDDSAGFSVFPPPPTVFRGYLRTAFFGERNGDVTGAGSGSDPTKEVCITHFSLINNKNERLFPLPADLVMEKDKMNPFFLELCKNDLTASSFDRPYLLRSTGNQKLEETGGKIWITQNNLINYLKGGTVSMVADLKNDIVEESKTGIGRDNATRTATHTGQLYQIRMMRPENKEGEKIGFSIGFKELDLKAVPGLGRLGGESKLTHFNLDKTEMKIPEPESGVYAKMYLATPAIFKEGWLPSSLFNDFGVEVVTAAVGRYQSFGGWDIARREPKPMYRAVPGGSVYYLHQKENGRLKELITEFHGKALNHHHSIPEGYEKEGFGIVWFGALQQQAIDELNRKNHVPAS